MVRMKKTGSAKLDQPMETSTTSTKSETTNPLPPPSPAPQQQQQQQQKETSNEEKEEAKTRKTTHKKLDIKNGPFPDDVVVYILTFLSEKDLCLRTSLVSKKWFVLSALDTLWEPLYWQRFEEDDEEEVEEEDEPLLWKNKFKLKFLEHGKKLQTEEPVLKEDKYHTQKTTEQVMDYLSPQERFSLGFDSYNGGLEKYDEEKYEEAIVLFKKAIYVLEKTFEAIEKEKDYPTHEIPKWVCLLAEAHASLGLSFRKIGYVAVAVNHYKKTIDIAERFLNDHKTEPIASFAREIIINTCKNLGVGLQLLKRFTEAANVYNKGATLLEEKVDIEYQVNKLNLKDIVNLLSYLTNRIFVLRHLKSWHDIAVDAVNVTNCYVVYNREKEQKLAQQGEVAEEYEIIEEIFSGMIQYQIARWPMEEQKKLLEALQSYEPRNALTQNLEKRLLVETK